MCADRSLRSTIAAEHEERIRRATLRNETRRVKRERRAVSRRLRVRRARTFVDAGVTAD